MFSERTVPSTMEKLGVDEAVMVRRHLNMIGLAQRASAGKCRLLSWKEYMEISYQMTVDIMAELESLIRAWESNS